MSKAEFDLRMPEEFWREVVDRVAREVPDTLLLAEAFWMMEGFFVRSLGMHRVYNSAFMNMLRDERNAEYRQVIKNTLEFDPQILKRYVNFMNNPDEKTAVEQFGRGDKYFGICTLMASLPGLPMFGHGQLEGFSEKYGMEYRRAMHAEQIDEGLVERHRKVITPLLHRRWLFSEVDQFLLFDFYNNEDQVNEDVFAFSNQRETERGLVLYNNRFAEARGWIKTSAGFARKNGSGKRLVQKSLGEGLSLSRRGNQYVIFRDQNKGLEYIRQCQRVHAEGLRFELGAYQVAVLTDFREVTSSRVRDYAHLTAELNDRGVPNIELALAELDLLPILNPFRMITTPTSLNSLLHSSFNSSTRRRPIPTEFKNQLHAFLDECSLRLVGGNQALISHGTILRRIEYIRSSDRATLEHDYPSSLQLKGALKYFADGHSNDRSNRIILVLWAILVPLVELTKAAGMNTGIHQILSELLLPGEIQRSLENAGNDQAAAQRMLDLLLGMLEITEDPKRKPLDASAVKWAFNHTGLAAYLGINTHQGIEYFNQQSLEQFTWFLAFIDLLDSISLTTSENEIVEQMLRVHASVKGLLSAVSQSGFQTARLLQLLTEKKSLPLQ